MRLSLGLLFQFKFNGALVVSTHRDYVPPKVMELKPMLTSAVALKCGMSDLNCFVL